MSPKFSSSVAFGLAIFIQPTAMAQRTQENAITSASDAFGTSIGNETIGLYRENNVRGFSPITAGNRRLEGLYFDMGGNGLTPRWTSRSVVRVGLPSLNYPFPAPSGIVDYSLRSSGNATEASLAMGRSEFGGYFVEADARVELEPELLSAAIGGHYQRRKFADGREGNYFAAAFLPTIRGERFSATTYFNFSHQRVDAPLLFVTSGPALPPDFDGGESANQKWANSIQRSKTYGLVGRYELTDALSFRLGAFESRSVRIRTYNELFTNVQPDGTATNLMIVSPRLPARWTSGEARLSWTSDGTKLDQTVHLSLRGRDKVLEGGGSSTVSMGARRVGENVPVPEPDIHFPDPTINSVRQWIAGLAYIGRWREVGEFNLALQKTGYRSTIERGANSATTRSSPWLYNAMIAMTPAKWLAIYGGYTRGIEETAPPPNNAVNRDDAISASRTQQKEAGIRVAFGDTRLVAGLFEIERPYYSIDENGAYAPLGTLINRGLETSLTAQPIKGLSLVAGAVFADPRVSGEAVDSGRAGPRAVGMASRNLRLDANWQSPFVGLSFDLSTAHAGSVAASTRTYANLDGDQLESKPFTTVDVGARYRFKANGTPMALRGLVANVFDAGGYDVNSSLSFFLRNGRRFSLQLSADL